MLPCHGKGTYVCGSPRVKHGPKHDGVKQEIMAWWGRGGCQEPLAWRGQKSEVIRKIRDQHGGRDGRILGGQRLACMEVDGESVMYEQVFGLSILGKFISLVSVFSRKLRPAFLCWHLCKARGSSTLSIPGCLSAKHRSAVVQTCCSHTFPWILQEVNRAVRHQDSIHTKY